MSDMKKIMLIAFLGFMATGAFAQDHGTSSAKAAKGSKKKATFYCPKCFSAGKSAAPCPTCKIDRIAEGDYYCPRCYVLCPRAKCPNCGSDGVRMGSH